MSAFTRSQRRFLCSGIQLTRPMDACDQGKWPILQNVRSVLQGGLQARQGLVPVPNAVFAGPIHSLDRMDDPTTYALNASLIVVGAGAALYTGPVGGVFGQVDTGYSGDPLSLAVAMPSQSPQPWLYVADRSRMRKTNANQVTEPWGIAPPLAAPTTVVQPLGLNIIERFGFNAPAVPWDNLGTQASAKEVTDRINTQIGQILYDTGVSGWASIAPNDPTDITEGMLLTVNGIEVLAVTELLIAVANTTIAAILYDVGATGLCTIQPVGSLGTGQLEEPSLADLAVRAGFSQAVPRGTEPSGSGVPPPPSATPTPTIRQLDFPVNCIVTLGGLAEFVRVLSVAVGPDGVQSFRCVTANTHVAGDAILGLAAFRAHTVGTYNAGHALNDGAIANLITPVNTPPQATAGMRTNAGWAIRNLAQINGRATLPEDDIWLAVRFSDYPSVQTVRVYFSVEPTAGPTPSASDFTANYYFFEWRQSDITNAIQGTNGQVVQSLTQAQQSTALPNAATTTPALTFPGTGPGGQRENPNAPPINPISQALPIGNSQWLTLHCKVGDLTRIGTDASKTLSTVTAAEIVVNVQGTFGVFVSYDALWLSGGFGPDTGTVGNPYVYCYRYRNSKTGGKSNPGPATLAGVIVRRQSVVVTGTSSTDPQVDLIDWFKLGGTLTTWTYCGTTPNNAPVFTDVYTDSALTGGESLDFDAFQPWPTQDLPRSGTCNIAGTAVQWISGDQFNTAWAPGSLIILNGQAYTLYAQPSSTTRLVVNENAGGGMAIQFALPGPTLLQRNFKAVWGGSVGGSTFLFGCGDATNPGQVHWTTGNDVETTSDKNTLDVSVASEPLQNGFMWDGTPYVASTDQVYVLSPVFNLAVSLEPAALISPTGTVTVPFQPLVTPCGKGFWTPWAFCQSPRGLYFLEKNGISVTVGGSAAVSITDADLYPLFPHDGVPGQAVNGFQPVDMTQRTRLRLTAIDGWIYFDYVDTQGNGQTLCFREADASWWPDTYSPAILTRWSSTGQSNHQALLAGADRTLYTPGGAVDAVGPGMFPMTCLATFVDDQQDARRQKLYRDLMLKAALSPGPGPVITIGTSDNGSFLNPVVLVGNLFGVQEYLVNTTPQVGVFGTNLTVQIAWSPTTPLLPMFEAADIAYQLAPELAESWLSGPTTHGQRGFQQIQRVLLAYVSTTPVTYSLIIDGVTYTYNLPNTNGLYAKNTVILQAAKGKSFQHGVQAFAPMMLFDADCEVWTSVWGQPGGYQVLRPF